MDETNQRLADRIRNFMHLHPQHHKEVSAPPMPSPQELTFTRGELGKTLHSIKRNQEALQTAVANARARSETAKFRFTNLQRFGRGSLAYSSLQEGLQYFMHEFGYAAYVQLKDSKDSVVVLADPICQPNKRKEFIDAFLQHKSDPVFLHITHETGAILNELGFRVNELGVETIIDIQDFDLVGNKKQQLRQARNNAKKDNLEIVELEKIDNATLKAFKKISEDWMGGKVSNESEMRFIVRPMLLIDELDVRKFVAKYQGEIVAFVIFDPMYEDGQVIGYIANHLRSSFKRSYSIVDCIILDAMEKFKAEGKRELSLGLSPLAKVDDTGEFKHSKLLTAHFQYAFEKANYLYNFKNLAQHKLKYRPGTRGAREEKVYCAMKTRIFLIRLNSVYKVLGLKPLPRAIARHVGNQVIEWVKLKVKRCFDAGECEVHSHHEHENCEAKTETGSAVSHAQPKPETKKREHEKGKS